MIGDNEYTQDWYPDDENDVQNDPLDDEQTLREDMADLNVRLIERWRDSPSNKTLLNW